jgi:hypothetical protein
MRIKHHPRAFVEVYNDGRVDLIFPDEAQSLADNMKMSMIESCIANLKKHRNLLAERGPGRYEVAVFEFRLLNQRVNFELIEV